MDDSAWLSAYSDVGAGLRAFSNSVCLSSVQGNDVLLVGDLSGQLKVVGARQDAGTKLSGLPSAVRAFFENGKMEASIAVASGANLYVYYKQQPSFKFSLDATPIPQNELDVWERMSLGQIDPREACEELRSRSDLSERSLDLVALENDPVRLESLCARELADANYRKPLLTCITCMEVLKKEDEMNENAQGVLVLGTESKKVVLLDPQTRALITSVQLQSVPVYMAVTGTLSVEYRIVVLCRDKRVYSIKNGDLVRKSIDLEAPGCGGVVRYGKELVVGCTDKSLHCFQIKGKKSWTLYMPCEITNISRFHCEHLAQEGFLVALRNGQVRLYIDRSLMSTIQLPPGEIATAVVFGRFQREPNTLLILCTSGSLHVKMLKRTAKLDVTKLPQPGPPAEQNVPLDIPKKTKLYIDQTQRERDTCVEMHRSFQHSLCKLRYVTAKSYVKLFQDSGVANAQVFSSSNSHIAQDDTRERLSLNVRVSGLGPRFRLSVAVTNVGVLPCSHTTVLFSYDRLAYQFDRALLSLPALIPQVAYSFDVDLVGLLPGAKSPPLLVSIVRDEAVLLAASVDMPVVETL